MTLQRDFVHRYTKIQKGLQERAELALAEATRAKSAADEGLRISQAFQFAAQEQRNDCKTAAELQMWHQYVQALEAKVQDCRVKVVDAGAIVEQQKQAVGQAYREAKRWSIMSDRYDRQYAEQVRAELQKQADEFASQRGKGAME